MPLTHVSGQHTRRGPCRGQPAAICRCISSALAAIKGQREATFATPRNIFARSASLRSNRLRCPARLLGVDVPAAP